jgi:hypothetical protein
MRFLFLAFAVVLSSLIHAQAPALIPYQAIARDVNGQQIVNSAINARFTIHDGTATGASVWQELQTVSTSALGLFIVQLGSIVPLTNVNWADDSKFMQVEIDLGSGFVDIGTQQMLSVPYALYAASAGSGSGDFTHFIGEEFGGGVIFHLWKDSQGQEHGLILDTIDLSISQAWSNVTDFMVGASAQSIWDGLSNSNAIVAQAGHTSSAAALCLNSTNGGQTDWYLPSIQELNTLWNNYYTVARTFSQIPGASTLSEDGLYWSSSDRSDVNIAYFFHFLIGNGYGDAIEKSQMLRVRAVRSF